MTPVEEVRKLCERIIQDWRDNTIKSEFIPAAVLAETILIILDRKDD